jgi:hypothetical protein
MNAFQSKVRELIALDSSLSGLRAALVAEGYRFFDLESLAFELERSGFAIRSTYTKKGFLKARHVSA